MNLFVDGVRRNPTLAQLKEEFANEQIDWDRNIKIQLAKRYFRNKNGQLYITKKAIEPYYNATLSEGNQTFRYAEVEVVKGSGESAVKSYTPTEVDFGKKGSLDFDFTGADPRPNYALFRWLMNHPMRKVEFDVVRPEKDADDEMEKTRKRLKVENMFITKSPAYIDDEKLLSLAGAFGMKNASATPPKQLRILVMQRALKDVPEFLKMLGSKEMEIKGMIQEAVDLKVIFYNKAAATYYYTYPPVGTDITKLVVDTDRPIYKVRPHMLANPADDFANFLADRDESGHLGIIKDGIMNQKDNIEKHPEKKGQGAESIRKFAEKMIVTV